MSQLHPVQIRDYLPWWRCLILRHSWVYRTDSFIGWVDYEYRTCRHCAREERKLSNEPWEEVRPALNIDPTI